MSLPLPYKIKISCSQFIRYFLATDAQLVKRKLNTHVNEIIKLSILGQLPQPEGETIFNFVASSILNFDPLRIEVSLQQLVYEKLQWSDPRSVRILIEEAIRKYIVFCLSDQEKKEIYQPIITEICQHIISINLEEIQKNERRGE